MVPLNCTLNAGISIHSESLHCAWGLISRLGWAIVDDADNWCLNPVTQWWESPNGDEVDFYFLGYGSDYKSALKEYTLIGGKIAMTPRISSGIMWTRWYNWNNHGVRNIVKDYSSQNIPLDVFILDMDWHTKYGWGGYTFDTNLFPIPLATMTWLKDRGIATSGNIHDAGGVRPDEAQYLAMKKAMGLPTNFT